MLRALLAALGDGGVAVAQSNGRLHPVCALWRTSALDALAVYLASGQRSLKRFAAAVGRTVVDWSGADTDVFANANTPEDLAALQSDFDVIAVVLMKEPRHGLWPL